MGTQMGTNFYTYAFQVLVGDVCTATYTNRDGNEDGKGDGSLDSQDIRRSGVLVRDKDSQDCHAKCSDSNKVKYIITGNPEVTIPESFDKSSLSWIDLSGLDTATELVNINAERTHDSSWLLKKDLDSCDDTNGDAIPDPAGLAYTDYKSTGRGRFNLDKSIFAKMPGNKWALHDFRAHFRGNTVETPMDDG